MRLKFENDLKMFSACNEMGLQPMNHYIYITSIDYSVVLTMDLRRMHLFPKNYTIGLRGTSPTKYAVGSITLFKANR